MRAVLMSERPNHLVNILNGKKTIEIRRAIPRGFIGWVYLYCTKRIPYLVDYGCVELHDFVLNDTPSETKESNGKVVARFWFNEYDRFGTRTFFKEKKVGCYEVTCSNITADEIEQKSCLNWEQLDKYSDGENKNKNLYAMHIKNLEIFDKPKELSEFEKWVRKTIYSGMDCPPYDDEVLVQITKPPQSWMYVEVDV